MRALNQKKKMTWVLLCGLLPMMSWGTPSATLTLSNDYLGFWKVGQLDKRPSYVVIHPDGTATKSSQFVKGLWMLEGGRLRITWSDGKINIFNKDGDHYTGKTFASANAYTENNFVVNSLERMDSQKDASAAFAAVNAFKTTGPRTEAKSVIPPVAAAGR